MAKMQPFWWFLPIIPRPPLRAPAWSYFDVIGEIWLQFYGAYCDSQHGTGSFGADPPEGYYFDRE